MQRRQVVPIRSRWLEPLVSGVDVEPRAFGDGDAEPRRLEFDVLGVRRQHERPRLAFERLEHDRGGDAQLGVVLGRRWHSIRKRTHDGHEDVVQEQVGHAVLAVDLRELEGAGTPVRHVDEKGPRSAHIVVPRDHHHSRRQAVDVPYVDRRVNLAPLSGCRREQAESCFAVAGGAEEQVAAVGRPAGQVPEPVPKGTHETPSMRVPVENPRIVTAPEEAWPPAHVRAVCGRRRWSWLPRPPRPIRPAEARLEVSSPCFQDQIQCFAAHPCPHRVRTSRECVTGARGAPAIAAVVGGEDQPAELEHDAGGSVLEATAYDAVVGQRCDGSHRFGPVGGPDPVMIVQ